MRCFLAIELPIETRRALSELRERLRRAGANASWPRIENMHLTLRFLGDITAGQLQAIQDILRTSLPGLAAANVIVRGTGAFPNTRKPSVVWVGVESPGGNLAAIQDACEEAVRAAGLSAETKPFRPHITLARLREPHRTGGLVRMLEAESGFLGGEFTAQSVTLFSSALTPHGAVYEPLDTFALQSTGNNANG